MCDAKGTRFFRPWNITEPINESASMERIDRIGSTEERRTVPPYIKREEDTESVLSGSTECEESSAASLSENEIATPGTIRGSRRRRRRRSESSADTSTRSCSVNSEDTTEGNSLDMLSNFVLNSQPITNYSATPAERENKPVSEESSTSAFSTSTITDRRTLPTYDYPADYLHRMTLLRANGFAAFNDGSARLLQTNMDPNTLRSTNASSALDQSYYYGFPGVGQFPQGLYATSVEEAVELINRQDAAAKQMKKLRPKKFRCEHCDVAFSNNGQLKGHIRIHTGERPFKCDAEGCGKSFTRNEELTRHKRIHTGLRPHSCVLCGKRFGRKDHLKKHTRTHDSRDPYRMSAAAFGVFSLGAHPLPPYAYPI